MDKWTVLPTDPKFLDLTEEQRAMLYVQYLESIKPPPQEQASAHDPDYEEPEKYIDPDFDEEWNNMDIDEPLEDKGAPIDMDEWKEVE